jgi:hypothetical protein
MLKRIGCPEKGQAFGQRAKQQVSSYGRGSERSNLARYRHAAEYTKLSCKSGARRNGGLTQVTLLTFLLGCCIVCRPCILDVPRAC